MKQNRRQLLRSVLGASASVAAASLTGCGDKCKPCGGTDFYLICHGMMVFDFQKSTKKLVLHLPNVPAVKDLGDPGHVYIAASCVKSPQGCADGGDYVSLADPKPAGWSTASLRLTGLDDSNGRITTPDHMNPEENVCLYSACEHLGAPGAEAPLVKIEMPFPRAYRGWREVYAQSGPLLNSMVPPQDRMPLTIYLTHVFTFSALERPRLVDWVGRPVWPKNDSTVTNKLHIFAQPEYPGKPSDSSGNMSKPMDHAGCMHRMFKPTLVINVSDEYCIHEELPANVAPKFTRGDLIDWNEKPLGPGNDVCSETERILGTEPTNCRGYGNG